MNQLPFDSHELYEMKVFLYSAFLVLIALTNSAQDFEETVEFECYDEVVAFSVVEKMPEYPGGDAALLKYIAENLPNPIISKDEGIPPMPIYVSYVVDEKGNVTNVCVEKGGNEKINPSIIELVESLKKYEPGHQRGKPVPVKFTLPIRIHFN